MNNYRMIVTDMDGTVLGTDHKITKDNKIALKKAEDKGIKIVFATGRFHESAKVHIDFLEEKMPIISSNGSIIKNPTTNEVLYCNSIDEDKCIRIIDTLDKYHLKYQIYTDEIILQKYDTEEEKQMMIDFIKTVFSDKTEIIFKKDLRDDIKNKNILKFNVMELERMDLIDITRNELNEIEGIEITSSWGNNLEIMSEGSTKGKAIEFLANLLNINREEIIAFGDNYNDVSMIEFVGTGVAMGNAEEDVKNIANYVTDANSESGVAKAIDKLVFEKSFSI
ncbi:HAD family phosphatase [Terrisporobacter mayombei]|nr:HAD family phosphatase [Terrisporobacter mayombei]